MAVISLLLVVGVAGGGGGAGAGGAAGLGREADDARAGVEAVGMDAGVVHEERPDGGRVPAGVHADVGDPEGLRRLVAALDLPLRGAVLVVLVRAPEVGSAPRGILP